MQKSIKLEKKQKISSFFINYVKIYKFLEKTKKYNFFT